MKARVAVTGATGFIGSHLSRRLLQDGAHVTGIDSLVASAERAPIADLEAAEGFELKVRDVRDPGLPECLNGAGCLLHLAGIPGARGAGSVYEEVNVGGTEATLAAAAEAGVRRVLIASSSSLYGSSEIAQSERAPLQPRSDYARSKARAEMAALSLGEQLDLEVIALRYFTVYGPGQRPDMLFAKAIEACLGGAPIPLYAGGRSVRSFTHVSDAVAGTLLAIKRGEAGQAYNIGGDTPVIVSDALTTIGEITERPVTTHEAESGVPEAATLIPDLTRSREVLGYEPKVGLAEGLRSQVESRLGQRTPSVSA